MAVFGIEHGTLKIEVGLVFHFAVVFLSTYFLFRQIPNTTQDHPIFNLFIAHYSIFNVFSFCPSHSAYIILYKDFDLDGHSL
jgi:hypothetical protein